MAECRYAFATRHAGRRVLEIGCGPAVGLGGLLRRGRRYVSAWELVALLRMHGFRAEVFGAFPISMNVKAYVILARWRHRLARRLDRIPGGRPAKRLLHRTLLGQSRRLDAELIGEPATFPGEALTRREGTDRFRILYAVGSMSPPGANA